MEKITLGKDENGKLSYTTSRGGKMFDITKELRAKAIDLEEMTKKVKPVSKAENLSHCCPKRVHIAVDE